MSTARRARRRICDELAEKVRPRDATTHHAIWTIGITWGLTLVLIAALILEARP